MPIQTIYGSTLISGAEYDPRTRRMDVLMTSGKTYTYTDVPQDVFDGLMSADSPGGYYHSRIKGRYT